MLSPVGHFIVRIDGPSKRVPDRDAWQRGLVVTDDDGARSSVSLVLSGPAQVDDDVWRAAVLNGVERLEFAFKGDGWGVHVEGGPTFDVELTEDQVAPFIGERSAGVSLDDGSIVGEFSI
jgi:hypothetical protein